MQCHYCDADAVVAPEHDGIKVGLCRDHFQQSIESFSTEPHLKEFEHRFET